MFGFGTAKRQDTLHLDATSLSATGLVRPDNQDNFYTDAEARVFCVADGMGGGSDGARASAIVCEHLRKAKLGAALRPLENVRAAIDRAIDAAHDEIRLYAAEHHFDQMGTTAAILAFDAYDLKHAAIGHIGDSRVYRIRRGMTTPLTRDHSIATALAEFGGKDAQSIKSRKNPLAHVLTRAIGVAVDTIRLDWSMTDVRAGDRYVICSDGVHDVISDARLAVFAGGGKLESARERLEREILAQGAPDNFTFIIVEVT